jgi:hypothetical protein
MIAASQACGRDRGTAATMNQLLVGLWSASSPVFDCHISVAVVHLTFHGQPRFELAAHGPHSPVTDRVMNSNAPAPAMSLRRVRPDSVAGHCEGDGCAGARQD